jgi:hypothetical protein
MKKITICLWLLTQIIEDIIFLRATCPIITRTEEPIFVGLTAREFTGKTN